MTRTIKLDDQILFQTEKINDPTAGAMLPAKFEPAELPITKSAPEQALCAR